MFERICGYVFWSVVFAILLMPLVAIGFFIAGNPVTGAWLLGVSLGVALLAYGAFMFAERVRHRRELNRRKAEGLMSLNESNEVAPRAEWFELCQQFPVDWLEDEVQQLLPADIVVRWGGSSGWTGLAINRGGKIVAVLRLMHVYRGSQAMDDDHHSAKGAGWRLLTLEEVEKKMDSGSGVVVSSVPVSLGLHGDSRTNMRGGIPVGAPPDYRPPLNSEADEERYPHHKPGPQR